MPKLRTISVGIACALVVLHIAVLLTQYGTDTASVRGDWIDAATPLIAAIVCWAVSRRSGPFGRRVWRLVSLSALLTSVGQSLYTYYFDYLHESLGTLWPSDLLVFFWIVPAMTTLFLTARQSGKGLEWLRAFDFVQVCALVLAVELSQIYVPSRWQTAGQSMESRTVYVGMLFFGLLAASFLGRFWLSEHSAERAFYGRMCGFLVVYGIVLTATLKSQASGHYQQGTWLDLSWTVAYALLIVLPGTWNEVEEPPARETRSTLLQLIAIFSPLLIPAIVFPLLLGIAQERFL
ncbi:MAG TPA: hypothetical protein VM715_03000, partial [Candidatus Acidoferrum sp.]|nr:hypothetical protein [Candidatus Acidoferrum sp.]